MVSLATCSGSVSAPEDGDRGTGRQYAYPNAVRVRVMCETAVLVQPGLSAGTMSGNDRRGLERRRAQWKFPSKDQSPPMIAMQAQGRESAAGVRLSCRDRTAGAASVTRRSSSVSRGHSCAQRPDDPRLHLYALQRGGDH